MIDHSNIHPRRLRRREAAEYLAISLSLLDKLRLTGTGPCYVKIGSCVLYDTRDLDDFLEHHRFTSTSQYS